MSIVMGRRLWRYYHLVIIVFLSLILLVLLIKPFKNDESAPLDTGQGQIIERLPDFVANDASGKTIRDEDFASMSVFVEFLDDLDITDTEFFNAITSTCKTDNLAVIGITSDSYKTIRNIGHDPNKVFIFQDKSNQLPSLFSVPSKSGVYFLFGPEGKLILKGNTYEGYEKRVKLKLTRLLTGRRFTAAEIAIEETLLNNIPWLNQLNNIVNTGDKEYYLFALFTSFCASCQQGTIVAELENLFLAKRQYMDVVSVIYPGYAGIDDLDSLKDQAKISYTMILADQELGARWASLINLYNASLLNNILILVSREGRIQKVADATCECYGDFLSAVKALN